METQDFLPEQDQDLQLALELGVTLDSGGNIYSIQDPLIQSLLAFKAQEQQEITALKEVSDEVWKQIAKNTHSSKKATITPISVRKANTWAWATAATVLLTAFLGIFWFTTLEQPNVIAQSGSSTETVTLPDGSEVILRPHSTLYELTFSETQRSYELEGEGFFTVSKDENRPFTVKSIFGQVTVLGTKFNISTWSGFSTVYLEEGSIKVENIGGSTAILEPGESINLFDSTIGDSKVTDGTEFKDWIDNTLILKSTSITQVIAELEHHYKTTIDISDIQNTSELITGTIPLTNLEETLNDLGTILGGTFRKVNSNSFVFIPLN